MELSEVVSIGVPAITSVITASNVSKGMPNSESNALLLGDLEARIKKGLIPVMSSDI